MSNSNQNHNVVIDSKEIHDDSESIASDESEEDMIGI
jgi:hypothetical protein